jgi:predicted DNA-binding transcriptional regulator AlpA
MKPKTSNILHQYLATNHRSPGMGQDVVRSGSSETDGHKAPCPSKSALDHSAYGFYRQEALLAILPFSAATLWRMVKRGQFVQPVKLSSRITAWPKADVHRWLEERGGSQ